MSFHVAGIPQPVPVRNDDTGLIEDGYRLTVVDNDTGARAILEIPGSQYSAENVQRLADYELGRHADVLASFQPPGAES